ncbi:MAG: peptidoglycan DD-metalloendopeptidase family protein [Candidatus Marinimicrobia bacterium]|nr:peptidoglycan DD-metalloendopeptidase family protein [Candidatus Neomarinimicrobiota bacterium]MCF7830128.1 peptidoglycan DD-metalloendopeptidase family protein [Candidatus Neomarinimicrobiota bacterium]MCF7882205.1 peptidoglycan DD-metalloendopeptidase family protein [Candidatus Neomarinimicrobiota bacterium]
MLRNRLTFGVIIVLLSAAVVPASAQDLGEKIRSQEQQLQSLEKEIQQFRQELETKQKREQSLLEQLNSLEKDISYTQQLVQQMERTQQEREKRIDHLNKSLSASEEKLTELKDRFARRAVRIYKQDNYSDIELLLTSRSLNQALIRYKYLSIINEADKKTFHAINNTIEKIESDRAELREQIQKQERLIAERRKEEARLKKDRSRRQNLLASVQEDQKSLRQNIEERQQAVKDLQELIAKLEEEKAREERERRLARQRASQGMETTTDIPSLKGKLPWPATGDVVTKFGTYRHPKLKTVTENPGIDIAAPKGTDVVAVLDGLVTTITFMRSYGNMIIIDHGSGFYTVYTHVVDIQVNPNSYVSTGDVIAKVGDSGSLDGAKLHFEIWGNREKLNPEIWLTQG